MGRDKAELVVAGEPLLARALGRLAPAVERLAVNAPVGSPAAELATRLGRPVLPDPPGLPDGPLSGVLAGLRWARDEGAEGLVVLPCDAPLLPEELPRRLAAALQDAPCAVARTPGGVQALCAGWRIGAEAALAARLEAGEHPAIWRLLSDQGCAYIDYPSEDAFLNLNTPEDIGRAEALLSKPRA